MDLMKRKKEDDFDFEKDLASLTPDNQERGSMSEKELFPSYDSEFSSIKKEVEKSSPMQRSMPSKVEFPQRRPIGPNTSQIGARPTVTNYSMPVSSANKSVFVKVESYQEVLVHLNNLRELVRQGESILSDLAHVRSQEDQQLNKWHQDIERIKDKLLSIDKKLFES